MQQRREAGEKVKAEDSRTGLIANRAPLLDAQLAALIQTVWACERQWKVEDRIDAAIRYGR